MTRDEILQGIEAVARAHLEWPERLSPDLDLIEIDIVEARPAFLVEHLADHQVEMPKLWGSAVLVRFEWQLKTELVPYLPGNAETTLRVINIDHLVIVEDAEHRAQ